VGGYSDSICDLQCLLTYVDNYANKRHKADATRSSTTNGSARRTTEGLFFGFAFFVFFGVFSPFFLFFSRTKKSQIKKRIKKPK
jgi:hypothetical protein